MGTFLCENTLKRFSIAYGFLGIVFAGFIFRVLIVVLAGGGMRTPWGGGGDTLAYVTLAQNLVAGKGYSYAGLPTAFRPPGYPIILATSMEIFGNHALAAVRWLQFFEGLAVAVLCATIAGRIFGKEAKNVTLVIALFFPTLAIMTGEILTEATATLFASIFLYVLVRYIEKPGWHALMTLAAIVGFAALVRFNMALLGFVVLSMALFRKAGLPKWRSAAVVVILSGLVISPWLIRNLRVFHGSALFSTQGGFAAVAGVVIPQGRALPGDSEKLKSILGWVPPTELETNNPSRLRLAAEPVLDQQCWKAAQRVWRQSGWGLVPMTMEKLSYFWLSTDQLLWTEGFPRLQRIARAGGVIVYWALLSLSIAGWLQTRARNPELARFFLVYAVLVTIMHIPFNMNTRYRMLFIDPLIAVLAGIGFLHVVGQTPTTDPSA